MVVDLDGLQERIVSLPISAGNYGGITVVGESVYYLNNSLRIPDVALKVFDLKEKKETEVGKFNNYVISMDQKKMLIEKDRQFSIIDLPKGKAEMDKKIDLSNMKVQVDRKKEWEQIFNESWRQMRDFFYDPGMHGVDWPAMKRNINPS